MLSGKSTKEAEPTFVKGNKFTFVCEPNVEEITFYVSSKSNKDYGTAVLGMIDLQPYSTVQEKCLQVGAGTLCCRTAIFPKVGTEQKKKYKYPLIHAVEHKDLFTILTILEKGKGLNEVDKLNNTPLHHAAMVWENESIILTLLKTKDVDVKVVNTDGNTPLHLFCSKYRNPNFEEAFRLFVEKGADLNAKNNSGETPLHKAVFNSSIRLLLVEALLEGGAEVNEQTKMGGTALHYAVQMDRTDLMSILLRKGADMNIKDSRGFTPYALAEDRPKCLATLNSYLWINKFLHNIGEDELRGVFYENDLFKEKLPKITEKELANKYHITSAGTRIKLVKNFKEIKIDAPVSKKKVLSPAEEAQEEEAEKARILDEFGKNWRIDEESCEFTSRVPLGEGASGKVLRGLYKGKPVAIKVLKSQAAAELREFEAEFRIACSVVSPYIVRLYGAIFGDKLKMVMELCEKGSLYDLLNKPHSEEDIGWDRMLDYAIEVISGVKVLHSQKTPILHRDLKTLNVLVTSDYCMKVCDFGMSRRDSQSNLQTLTQMRGTYAYMAPELADKRPYTDRSDIYSFGIMLWEMTYRTINKKYQRPFGEYPNLVRDFQIIIQVSKHQLRPTIPSSTPKSLSTLILQCIQHEPLQRPQASDVWDKLQTIKEEFEENKEQWNKAIVTKDSE